MGDFDQAEEGLQEAFAAAATAWADAADGLIDAHRLAALLRRIKGQIVHRALAEVSPLSVPVMLEIGRESVYGEAHDALLAEAAENLIDEAMRLGSDTVH